MGFSPVCRLCLADENLTPIFVTISEFKKFSGTILLTTGIKVNNLTISNALVIIFIAVL